MATVTLNGPSYYLSGTNVDSLNSPVVGYESKYNRVARYSFTSPASGASKVSLSFTGMTFVAGTQKPLRFYIGTSDSDHANAGANSTYTGEMSYSGSTWSGSASIILQPATTYYLWIFPSAATYGYWYWNTGSASMSTNGGLKTTISAGDGTLGADHTITLNRYSTDFKHKLTATCGTSTVNIASDVQAASYTWTPPLDWCKQSTSSIYVSVTLCCETFSGSTSCGTTETTVTMVMPDSIKPTVSLSVSDPNNHKDKYGDYVQNRSQAKVTTSTSGVYGSSIGTTVISVGSASLSATSGTFSLPSSGTVTVTVTVTDSRGRSATASTTISVLAYSAPAVQITSQYRCDSAGNAQADGAYIKVVWSATITSLSSKNTTAYTLKYRVRGASSWSSVSLSGSYSVSNSTKIISASVDNVYDLCVTAKDAFGTVESAYRTVASAGNLLTVDREARKIKVNAEVEFAGATSHMIEDAEYAGCYYRKVNGVVEWLNPPLVEGVEYRTVERYNGSAVYTKLINCGLAAVSKEVDTGAYNIFRHVGNFNGNHAIPYALPNEGDWWAQSYYYGNLMGLLCGSGFAGTACVWYEQIWYIK